MTEPEPDRAADEEKPPFGGSWTVLYGIVLLNLIAIIVVCYIFTKIYE